MPFIRGRYHINPIAGAALEAAREAEEALTARNDAESADASKTEQGAQAGRGSAHEPIHRVEIEAAEVVPSHSGRAQRGFVARIHRGTAGAPSEGRPQTNGDFAGDRAASGRSVANSRGSSKSTPPETHVFANHEDLTDFLRREFERDCQQ